MISPLTGPSVNGNEAAPADPCWNVLLQAKILDKATSFKCLHASKNPIPHHRHLKGEIWVVIQN